jgi:hypothetical protein
MKARFRSSLYTTLAVASVLLAACARDVTAPSRSSAVKATPTAISSFRPSKAAKALYGVSDGVYTLTFNPAEDQSFNLGLNHLDMPANSICDIATSSYGPGHWSESCEPQTDSVTITVVITGATTDSPRIDFHPSMRFSPDKNVELFMFAPNQLLSDGWRLGYCNDENVCVDEAKTDPDMQSYIDHDASVVFRRVKHFSGFIVTCFPEEALEALPELGF